MRLQGIRKDGVVIQDDVWIDSGMKILDGVTIGKGSIIAMGAVVAKNVSECDIVAGVPAQLAGWRGGKMNSGLTNEKPIK